MATTQPTTAGTASAAAPSPVLTSSAVPILPSLDLDRTLAFYSYLGFELLGRTEDYLRVALDGAEVHFYLAPELEPMVNGAGCYLRFADPDALLSGWSADGVACLEMPSTAAYGRTLFAIVDPAGNTLRIGPLPVATGATTTVSR